MSRFFRAAAAFTAAAAAAAVGLSSAASPSFPSPFPPSASAFFSSSTPIGHAAVTGHRSPSPPPLARGPPRARRHAYTGLLPRRRHPGAPRGRTALCAYVPQRSPPGPRVPHRTDPVHGDTTLRLFAAALCRVLGRQEEGAQWLHDSAVPKLSSLEHKIPFVPDLSSLEHKIPFVQAVLVATLGSAPRVVAGSEELVLVTMLGLLELSMWSILAHSDLPDRLQLLALMAFLRGVVAKKLHRDDGTEPVLIASVRL